MDNDSDFIWPGQDITLYIQKNKLPEPDHEYVEYKIFSSYVSALVYAREIHLKLLKEFRVEEGRGLVQMHSTMFKDWYCGVKGVFSIELLVLEVE
jgi:hypothetical protein